MPQQDAKPLTQLNEGSTFPRLTIIHLLLLTLTVSFILACSAQDIADSLGTTAEVYGLREWRWIVGTTTNSIASGIKLFGLIVLMRGWLRGPRFAMAPGHWYFLILGPLVLYGMISHPIYGILFDRWGSGHRREVTAAFEAIYSAVWMAGVGVSARAVVTMDQWRWKICMAILGAWLICLAALSVSQVAQNLWATSRWHNQHLLAVQCNLQIVFAASFLVAAILDGLRCVRRDWLHYLALAAILLDSINTATALGPFLARWWSSAIARLIG